MPIEISTWIGAEVPCIARAIEYEPEEPPYTRGHPDNWEPGQPASVDFEPFDEDGEFDPNQLWCMASERDLIRIADELIEEIESENLMEMEP